MKSLAALTLILATTACTAPAPTAAPTSGPPVTRTKPAEHGRWPTPQLVAHPTTTTTVATTTTTRASTVTVETTVVLRPAADVWRELAMCETGGKMDNPNTGNGYYGYFQFALATWRSVGGPGYPHEHSYETQLHYAQILQARSGWGQWPACSRKLGLA